MVPIELIYEVIDQLPLPNLLEDPEATYSESRRTLRFCALVSRSFARPSQMRLFSLTSVKGKDIQSLYAVLSSSPHLRGYIRTLHLRSRLGSSPSDLLYWVLKIFDATEAVDTLIMDSGIAYNRVPSDHLPFDSTIPLLSRLPSLRCLQLISYRLRNPFELQSLLTTSASLRELKIQAIYFDEDDYQLPIVESGQGLQLESLSLAVTSPREVDAMLHRFTMVDIEHVKSLSTDYSVAGSRLLRANAGSLRDLTINMPWCGFRDEENRIWPEVLACAGLTTLTLTADILKQVLAVLPLFGNFGRMSALKTIRIVLWDLLPAPGRPRTTPRPRPPPFPSFDQLPQWAQPRDRWMQAGIASSFTKPHHWAELDRLLTQTSITGVEVYVGFGPRATRRPVDVVKVVKNRLPSLSSGGRLQVFSNAGLPKRVKL
ncbi:hypothetical protein C8R45DRAFT_252446 [Mycena sanguinolenta]|nr:hypothetical protein C8R45DRAFT_252446 [Mycena sanguinolenta]